MKKFFFLIFTCIVITFLALINIFLYIYSDSNHLIGMSINLILYFTLIIICIIISNNIFKKSNLTNSKNYRKDIKKTFADSFFKTSIISIFLACIIYGYLKDILKLIHLKEGLINYCIFSTKIWFISSPFLGLTITVFRYFYELDYFYTPIFILLYKLFTFFLISFLFFYSKKINCFLYAKTICDIIFLIYYSKVCFSIILQKM